jgi:hypothetical protein
VLKRLRRVQDLCGVARKSNELATVFPKQVCMIRALVNASPGIRDQTRGAKVLMERLIFRAQEPGPGDLRNGNDVRIVGCERAAMRQLPSGDSQARARGA